MKKFRSIAILTLVGVLGASLVACSPKSSSSSSSSSASGSASSAEGTTPSTNKDFPEMVKTAVQKINEVKDFKSTLTYDVTMDFGEEAGSNAKSSIEVQCIEKPLLMSMETTVKMDDGTTPETTYQMYTSEENDDKYIMYMGVGEQWLQQEATADQIPFAINQYKTLNVMKGIFNFAESFDEVGEEKLGDMDTVKFEGKYTNAGAQSIFELGKMYSMAFSGVTKIPAEFYVGYEGGSFFIWIDKETGYPVKYSMELSEPITILVQNFLEATATEETEGKDKPSYSKYLVEAELYDFENVDKFEIPEAAKNGEVFDPEAAAAAAAQPQQ